MTKKSNISTTQLLSTVPTMTVLSIAMWAIHPMLGGPVCAVTCHNVHPIKTCETSTAKLKLFVHPDETWNRATALR